MIKYNNYKSEFITSVIKIIEDLIIILDLIRMFTRNELSNLKYAKNHNEN